MFLQNLNFTEPVILLISVRAQGGSGCARHTHTYPPPDLPSPIGGQIAFKPTA
jgi:hypothetical protein